MAEHQPTRQLAVQDYIDIFRRRWLIIVGILALAVGAAALATATTETLYRSRAEVLIRTSATDQLFPSAANTGNRLVRQSQAELTYLRTDAYRNAAADALGRPATVSIELVSEPSVSDTGTIRFENTDAIPERAAEAAQTYADTYIATRNANDLADVRRQLAAETETQEQLTAELTALRAPLDAIEAEILRTTDPVDLANLTTRQNVLLLQLGGDVARLESELQRTSARADELAEAADVISDPAMTAIISQAARTPTSPVSAGFVTNLLIALAVGALAGVGAALLREALDTRTHSDDDIARLLGLNVLGHVGKLPKAAKAGALLVNEANPDTASLEAFRSIRSSIMFAQRDNPLDIIQVTSPKEGNGKTSVATNLAVAFAQQGESTLIIDADLRRPQVHKRFLVTGLEKGLSDVLNETLSFHAAIRFDTATGVSVLPVGTRPDNPSELLGSDALQHLVKDALAEFDVVIVDSPPVLPVPDARLISAVVDGVVLVADPKTNDRKVLSVSKDLLEKAGAQVIGLVLNRVSTKSRGYRHSYGYDYS